ncbi:SixA phosphatase family protein [Cognatilysobacter bugurensis]|uniref:Histidine phosphatase family protein n=1 Tax=Cognatilysobacter bugurensis TaxID=543356 RepID=A0A918SUE4_9GAMM|nr:phosphoglycerate mutase family protein [Lysobacter bugurensis]GHA69454.1 hypothetical protein GCM10007067_01740 [Lysobacter bugurensis]
MTALPHITTRTGAWTHARGAVRIGIAAVVGFSTLLLGCASAPAADASAVESGPTYLLVRHAEKSTADPRDPTLTPAGEARAQRLAAELRDAPLVAVYSTDTRRTRATATPAAQAHGLSVEAYDPRAAEALARDLRTRHPRGLVLVVGHSNTVPALAAALCSCTVPPMGEHDYALRYRLRAPGADGPARLEAETW